MKCYACDKKLRTHCLVMTSDKQVVYVGPDCFKRIKESGKKGFQPLMGGPRLFLVEREVMQAYDREFNNRIDEKRS